MLVVGVGNPENFIKLIETNELKIKKLIYPDHHIFTKKEIEEIVETAKRIFRYYHDRKIIIKLKI